MSSEEAQAVAEKFDSQIMLNLHHLCFVFKQLDNLKEHLLSNLRRFQPELFLLKLLQETALAMDSSHFLQGR